MPPLFYKRGIKNNSFLLHKRGIKNNAFLLHTRGIKSKFLSIADLDIITFYYIQGEFKGKGTKEKRGQIYLNLTPFSPLSP